MAEKLFDNYILTQSDEFFKLTTDSVFLSEFIKIEPGKRAIELGCGAGALWVLAAAKNLQCTIDGAEIIPAACELARKNQIDNGFENRGEIKCCDVRELACFFEPSSYDVCFANPPYFSRECRAQSANKNRESARAGASILEFCQAASTTLRENGKFYFCSKGEDAPRQALAQAGLALEKVRRVNAKSGGKTAFYLFCAVKTDGQIREKRSFATLEGKDGAHSREYLRCYRRRA